MKVKNVSSWRIEVELEPLDAVSLACLCEIGQEELDAHVLASRLKVPRRTYYETLGAALRASALAAVCRSCLPEGEYERLNAALQEAGIEFDF